MIRLSSCGSGMFPDKAPWPNYYATLTLNYTPGCPPSDNTDPGNLCSAIISSWAFPTDVKGDGNPSAPCSEPGGSNFFGGHPWRGIGGNTVVKWGNVPPVDPGQCEWVGWTRQELIVKHPRPASGVNMYVRVYLSNQLYSGELKAVALPSGITALPSTCNAGGYINLKIPDSVTDLTNLSDHLEFKTVDSWDPGSGGSGQDRIGVLGMAFGYFTS